MPGKNRGPIKPFLPLWRPPILKEQNTRPLSLYLFESSHLPLILNEVDDMYIHYYLHTNKLCSIVAMFSFSQNMLKTEDTITNMRNYRIKGISIVDARQCFNMLNSTALSSFFIPWCLSPPGWWHNLTSSRSWNPLKIQVQWNLSTRVSHGE